LDEIPIELIKKYDLGGDMERPGGGTQVEE
jgi:hypothetical protein